MSGSIGLTAGDDPLPWAAWKAAKWAHQAVFEYFADDPGAWGTERMREVEIRTPECVGELECQRQYLVRIEAFEGTPPGYAELIEQRG